MRDGFDFFLYYLSDYDYASHVLGSEGAAAKLGDADRAVAAVLDAAGGPEVSMLAAGLDVLPASITEIAPAVLAHFGVEPPPYVRRLSGVV
jgi:hypothetical protein